MQKKNNHTVAKKRARLLRRLLEAHGVKMHMAFFRPPEIDGVIRDGKRSVRIFRREEALPTHLLKGGPIKCAQRGGYSVLRVRHDASNIFGEGRFVLTAFVRCDDHDAFARCVAGTCRCGTSSLRLEPLQLQAHPPRSAS